MPGLGSLDFHSADRRMHIAATVAFGVAIDCRSGVHSGVGPCQRTPWRSLVSFAFGGLGAVS